MEAVSDNGLEPCGYRGRPECAAIEGVAGRALRRLLVSHLRLHPAPGLSARARAGPDSGLLHARVLEKGLFAEADPDRGRFRSFLRTVCTHYLSNRRDREKAQKRGGGRAALSIDSADAESRYTREPSHQLTPDRIFDRSWALTLLTRVFDQLRREYEDAGRGTVIDELHAVLTEDPRAVPYSMIAARLGIREGAVRVAVHRLRRRYGTLLRQEIAATVDDPAEVDDEIKALFAALKT